MALQCILHRASGGVIFTTIQKFSPQEGVEYKRLSERRNIIFIADEAHRSQYGLDMHLIKDKETDEKHIAYGFAKYLRDALPNASYIGFTGTPIELADRNTRAIFGEYIDVYDIHRSVEDGATVRIYYEARTVPLKLDENERPQIDPKFEEVTEGQEPTEKEKLKSKWGRQEALVGATDRIEKIAADIVQHFEERQQILEGKAMIVCMSRRICVELYEEIIKIRPDWHDSDDEKGSIKVVMTGSASDEAGWQQHIRSKKGNEGIAKRFKDASNSLKLVIVRDMWLTGFDVPCLHTMYLDKPMVGHGLMQTGHVKAQSFEAKLAKAVKLYQERAVEAALTMLRANAEEIRNTVLEDEKLGLSEDALAFYDALKEGNSHIQETEDEKLRKIAEELVSVVKNNVSPDWTIRQSTRAHLSRTIKRFLRQSGYQLEQQQKDVVELIVKQAEVLSQDWNTA